ncbi:MAG: hypothetical protein AAGI22_20340 [Planctomycetota bacterium]
MFRNPIFWAWVALLALGGVYTLGWTTDNRVERWVGQTGATPGFELLAERFGGDEFVLVRSERLMLDAEDRMTAWRASTEALRAAPAAAVVFDPLELAPDGAPLERLAAAAERPVVRALGLVDTEAPFRVDRIVTVRPGATPAERNALSAAVDDLRRRTEERGETFACAGHPLVATALDAEARRVEQVFAPLLVVAAALAVAAFLRSARLAIAALLPAGAASIGARAALRAAGVDSDLILVAVGPVAFVLVLAAVMHPVVAFKRHLVRGVDPSDAWRKARREKLRAGIAAAVTTAAGFGVFLTSGMTSVAIFGGTISVTMVAAIPVTFVGLGAILGHRSFGGLAAGTSNEPARRPWTRWARRVVCHRKGVLAGLALTFALGGAGFTRLSSETNPLGYFPRGHVLASDFASIEASGTPLSTVDVLAQREDGAPFELAAVSNETLGAALAADPDASSVLGPATVAADVRAEGGAAASLAIPVALRASERLDSNGEVARWTVRVPTVESAPMRAIVERLEERARAWGDANGARILVAGSVPSMLAMQDVLISTLVRSILLTALVSAAFFVFVTRDPRELAAAFIANFAPLSVVALGAWIAGVPLDGATVMVAACVLGLAVDNTLHLLLAARRTGVPLAAQATPSPRARLRAFDVVGTAAFVSSAALALGFGALALSGFAPTARFGALAALGCVAAFASDMVVLPAVWVRTRTGS